MRAATYDVVVAIVKDAQAKSLALYVDGEFLSIFPFPFSKFDIARSELPPLSGAVRLVTSVSDSTLQQCADGSDDDVSPNESGPARR